MKFVVIRVTEWVQGKIISLNEPGQVSDIGGGAGGAAGQAVDKAGRRKTKSESDEKGKGPFVVVLLPPKAAAVGGGRAGRRGPCAGMCAGSGVLAIRLSHTSYLCIA